MAERLREAVEAFIVPWDDHELAATISIGVGVATDVTDSSDAKALFKVADEQLYKAKRGGRNRVEIALDSSAAVLST